MGIYRFTRFFITRSPVDGRISTECYPYTIIQTDLVTLPEKRLGAPLEVATRRILSRFCHCITQQASHEDNILHVYRMRIVGSVLKTMRIQIRDCTGLNPLLPSSTAIITIA